MAFGDSANFRGDFYWTIITLYFYCIPTAVICAQLANYDYYRGVVFGEKMWRGMPDFLSRPIGTVGFPLIALGSLLAISTLSPSYVTEMDNQILEDVSGVWRGETAGEIVAISIGGKAKTLTQIRDSTQNKSSNYATTH